MNDYLLSFPTAALAAALKDMASWRADAGIDAGADALGDPRDDSGAIVLHEDATWTGRPGIAASSYVDEGTGETVQVPARGDPARYYVHIRATERDPDAPRVDPRTYGLDPADPVDSAAVLGVWAGDPVPGQPPPKPR